MGGKILSGSASVCLGLEAFFQALVFASEGLVDFPGLIGEEGLDLDSSLIYLSEGGGIEKP